MNKWTSHRLTNTKKKQQKINKIQRLGSGYIVSGQIMHQINHELISSACNFTINKNITMNMEYLLFIQCNQVTFDGSTLIDLLLYTKLKKCFSLHLF